MRVRKMDTDGDMMFGSGDLNFWKDVPEAPAQCALTRLSLELGDWYLDRTEGMPWRTKVLGERTGSVRDPVLRGRILGTKGVSEILEYSSSVNRETRAFKANVTIDTIFGAIAINGQLNNDNVWANLWITVL